jgi:hypothetical protein
MAAIIKQTRERFFQLIKVRGMVLRYLIFFSIGLAGGRGQLGGLFPFAASLAVVSVLFEGAQPVVVAGGLLAGLLLRSGYIMVIQPADLLVLLTALLLARQFKVAQQESALPTALLAGVTDMVVKATFFMVRGGDLGFWPGLASEAVLTSLLAMMMVYALQSKRPWQRETRLLLLLVLAFCGFGDLPLGVTNLREVLTRIVLLATADGWGAGWAAGVGVVIGLLGGDIWQALQRTGFYAGIGFFAGLLRSIGRNGLVFGFIIASLLLSVFYSRTSDLSGHLLASGLAVVFYILLRPLLDRQLGRTHEKDADSAVPLQIDIGFAQRAKPSEPICGDSLAVSHLEPYRLLLTVSDGMGAGINAARESRIVVKLLEQLISCGISPHAAAEIINTALYMRGGEECAATIDMAMVDLQQRSYNFLKVGASPSYLKSGGKIEMIRSLCWPAGILDQVEPEVLHRQILPGDILIMATDGVTESGQELTLAGDWLYHCIQGLPLEEAQAIADSILQHAMKTSGWQNKDDMTVLVACFNSEQELE